MHSPPLHVPPTLSTTQALPSPAGAYVQTPETHAGGSLHGRCTQSTESLHAATHAPYKQTPGPITSGWSHGLPDITPHVQPSGRH